MAGADPRSLLANGSVGVFDNAGLRIKWNVVDLLCEVRLPSAAQ